MEESAAPDAGDCQSRIRTEEKGYSGFEELRGIVARLRAPDGCPWDREQTHESLKAAVIEEAAEVVCGINVLNQENDAENLKEELGDLLLQVMMHAQIAEEEGLFTIEDVVDGVSRKMIRRHPHVFGNAFAGDAKEALQCWEDVKKTEKAGKERLEKQYLGPAFREARDLISRAERRKGIET